MTDRMRARAAANREAETTKVYERTEDGTTTRVTAEVALVEGRAAMTDRVGVRAFVAKISRESGGYDITYKDGRRVVLAPVNVKPAAAC